MDDAEHLQDGGRGRNGSARGRTSSGATGSAERYRGGSASTVRLRVDDGGPALDGAVLRTGDTVLIAATDGRVAACGLSAVDSPELRRYYDRAFPE